MTRGRFISLEGGEGVGKTSSLNGIAAWLRDRGIDPIITREPGGTALGERLRELILGCEGLGVEAELLMIFAARADHVREVINPALAAGRWVLSDRFVDASYAYQGGGRGIAVTIIRELEEWILGALQPDLTFLLDAPVETGLARARTRGEMDRFESEGLQFLERVRSAYLDRARNCPERIVVIDAARPREWVMRDIQQHLQRCFWS